MLLAGVVAIWKGWQIHRGEIAVLAYGLGVLALALAVAPDAQSAHAAASGLNDSSQFY